MDDTISRQAAIDVVRDVMLDFIEYEDEIEVPMGDTDKQLLSIKKAISKRIKALPSAQLERKKGLWIVETETDIKRGTNAISGYKCNKCGYFVPWDFTHKSPFFIEEYNFCPHCGVDTRREKHEAN